MRTAGEVAGGGAPAAPRRASAPALVAGTAAVLASFAANQLLSRAALGPLRMDAGAFTAVRLASGALALLVLVAGFLLVTSHNVVTDADAATKHRSRTSAFYVAEAGLQYAFAQARLDSSWTGLAAPGKNCMEGNFTVAVTRADADGSALPANQKRYVATGTVGSAQAVASITVSF